MKKLPYIHLILICEECGNIVKETDAIIPNWKDDENDVKISVPICPHCAKKARRAAESKGYREGVKRTQQRYKAQFLDADLSMGHSY